MKKCHLFVLYICLVVCRAQEEQEFNDVNTTRINKRDFYDDELYGEFYEYTNNEIENPAFDLVELMKQPQLSGVVDENWPYPEDENPLSQYNKITGCKHCYCGIKPVNRVVNGSFAKRDEFPWQVLITYKHRLHCGGSIINDKYVLTAAHCVLGFLKAQLTLRFGAFKRHTRPGIYRKVDRIWISKKYSKMTHANDISIIKLKTKLRITLLVKPICLPIPGSTYVGVLATVAGWGALYFGGPASEVLKKVQVPVLSNEQCRKTGYGNSIGAVKLCAGNNGKDSCSGDSGGALITFQRRRYREIGIVSYGRGCNEANYPGVYARVTSFLKDIISIASQDNACWCSDTVK